MSYTPDIAAALSGATLRQLSYWRSARTPEPLLSPEFHTRGGRVFYSFRDVVALRAFVYLRAHDVPLQRVRKAVTKLRDMGETEHLSRYSLVAMGRDVAWRVSDEEAVDLTRQPGQHVIAQMIDILRPFQNMQQREVVSLYRPKPGVHVDPEVRGGYPVLAGSRVPYHLVAALLDDGLSLDEVTDLYPSVSRTSVQGAVEFARYVEQYRNARTTA